MTKEEVFEAAKALEPEEEEGCTFKGLPTKHWWDGFRKRAVEPGTLIPCIYHTTYHAAVQPLVVTPTYVLFFNSFTSEWENMALTHLETSINLDETQIVLDPTQKHVVVVCGTKLVHKLAGIYGERGVHITMVAACSNWLTIEHASGACAVRWQNPVEPVWGILKA